MKVSGEHDFRASREQVWDALNDPEILAATPMIAEGVGSSPVVCELAAECAVEMPLAEQVRAVCAGESSVADAVAALLRRPPTSE